MNKTQYGEELRKKKKFKQFNNYIIIFVLVITSIAYYSSLHNIDLVHNADLLKTVSDCNAFTCMDLEEMYKKAYMYVFMYPLIVTMCGLIAIFINKQDD